MARAEINLFTGHLLYFFGRTRAPDVSGTLLPRRIPRSSHMALIGVSRGLRTLGDEEFSFRAMEESRMNRCQILVTLLPQAAGGLPVAPAPDYLLPTLLEALIRQRAHDVVELPSPRGHLLDPLDLACVAELAEPVHSLSSVFVSVCSSAKTSPAM